MNIGCKFVAYGGVTQQEVEMISCFSFAHFFKSQKGDHAYGTQKDTRDQRGNAGRDRLYENKIRQLHNQETALTAAYSKEERRVRTRRLCTEAGILEHYVPELKTMDERNTSDFIRLIACSEVAKKFLRMRGLRNDEVPTDPTPERPLDVPVHPVEDTGIN
ncbi:MAG: DUF3847 domain-containing protein [Clostridiales bacterium]|nr:DUF3847 domain-containing protein [Clostridiales bacterium]